MQLFKLFSSLSILGLALVLGSQLRAQNTADTPTPLELGSTSRVILDRNESAYFKITLPLDEIRVILDTRMADGKIHDFDSGLSVLDRDGGVVQSGAIVFHITDEVSSRKIAYFTLKKPVLMGFKVTNNTARAYFWITVARRSDHRFVPLYGNIVPAPIMVGEGKTALLAEAEDAYYTANLPSSLWCKSGYVSKKC